MFQNLSGKLAEWFDVKLSLIGNDKVPNFHEREIWWCSVGLNVGYEIVGKDALFVRPVLIMKKYSDYSFLCLPLTSKRKSYPNHYHFDLADERGSILLDQAKTLDARRLSTKMTRINSREFAKIVESFVVYNFGDFPPFRRREAVPSGKL